MSARVVSMPEPADRHVRQIPTEAEARALTGAGLQAVRESAGLTPDEWSVRLGAALGRPITGAMVRLWESPSGPMPPTHWAVVAFFLGGPEVLQIASRLLSS